MTTAMTDDDLIQFEAPKGWRKIYVDVLMETEADVLRVAEEAGGEAFYLPDETDRNIVMFRDERGLVLKIYTAMVNPL